MLLFSIVSGNCSSNSSCSDCSSDDNVVTAVLATLFTIAVIGLVISVVINIVQRKQSRCVVTIVSFYVVMASCCCRYDVDQSSMRYSEVKQSVSGSNTITDFKPVKPPEPEYEYIAPDPTLNVKLGHDVKMDANPAYQATS